MFGFGGGGIFGGGGAPFGAPAGGAGGPGSFDQTYKCYPSSFFAATKAQNDPEHYESSDKILLPPSALHILAQLHIEYPMLFELIPHNGAKRLHCGVLEFVAEEGQMFVPFWMMENMQLEEGDLLTVRNASLEKGTYVKFRPQSKKFVELANPRAVLERTLAKYSCLTKNETIRIFYNQRTYDIDVMEIKSASGPTEAVSIIEADVNVDFEECLDSKSDSIADKAPAEVFVPDTVFSQAANQGCVAVPTTWYIEEESKGEGRTVGKQSKKSKKAAAAMFKGVQSPGPMVPAMMVIGDYAPEGTNVPFDYDGKPETLPSPKGDGYQGTAGMTLRAAKAH